MGKSTKNDGYGPKGVICDRKPTQNCYNIPRKIQVEVCKTDVHRYCEKFSNIFPFPVEEQNCHFEPKKLCELDEDSSQESQEVQLHQGLQGAAEGDLRPMREEVSETGLRDAAEVGVRVHA